MDNNNPFKITNKFICDLANLRDKYASDMVDACRDHILNAMERVAPHGWTGSWRYVPGGDFRYVCEDVVNHPAGYHEIGTMRGVTFAAYSAWSEKKTRVVPKHLYQFGYTDEYATILIELADKIMTMSLQELDEVTYGKWVNEIEPIWLKIKRYW